MPVDPESLRPQSFSPQSSRRTQSQCVFLCDLCVLGGEGLELRPHVTY